jgi:hypothetical protein
MLKIASLDLGHATLVLGAKPVSGGATSQGSGDQNRTEFAQLWDVLGQDEGDIKKQQPDLDAASLTLVDEREPVEVTNTPERSLMPNEDARSTQMETDVQRQVHTTIDRNEKIEMQPNAALIRKQIGAMSFASATPPPVKQDGVTPFAFSHNDLGKADSIIQKNEISSGTAVGLISTKENAMTLQSIDEAKQELATNNQRQDSGGSTTLPSQTVMNLLPSAVRSEVEVEGQTAARTQSEAQASVPVQVQTGTQSPSTIGLPLFREGAAPTPSNPAETRIINQVQLLSAQTVGSSWTAAGKESVAEAPNIALPPEGRSTSESMPRSAAIPVSSQIPNSPRPVSTIAETADNRQFIAVPDATTGVEPLLSNLQTGTAPHASQSHATPLTSAHAPKVAAQLVASALQISNGTTQIILNPEELGRVRMTLTTTEHGIAVAIAAERPETIDLMRRHVDLLVKEFEDLNRGDVAFSFGGNGTNSGETESKNEKTNRAEHDAATPDLATIPIRSTATSSGLDLKL